MQADSQSKKPSSGVFNTPGYRAGDWIIISGQTGRVGETLVPGGFEAECRQALENFGAIVEQHGLSRSAIAKINIFLVDMADRSRLNEIYLEFFGKHLPARTTVGVNQLSRNARVEIEGWAYAGPTKVA
ncbi:RidA family protein [Microbacteriaceae bacterium K1510]|nr:RidA family protein [Microbacteriaceae bacterium K1510]